MRLLQSATDFSIRPSLRVAGALLMLLLAYFFVDSAMAFFQAEQLTPKPCGRGKGSRLCELSNFVWSFVPSSVHGEIEGTSGLVAAGFSLYFAWLLLKPVLWNARKARGHEVA
jgi:hypothetical protein